MPVLPEYTKPDVVGAFNRGAIVSEGLMDRARARKYEAEDRAFEVDVLRPVKVAQARAAASEAASRVEQLRHEANLRTFAAESRMEAAALFDEIVASDPLYAANEESRVNLRADYKRKATEYISRFGALADVDPAIKQRVDYLSKEVANLNGQAEMELQDQLRASRELELQKRLFEQQMELEDKRRQRELDVQAERNKARGTGTPDRVTQWMSGRDRALAEGRQDDADAYQQLIDTYRPSAGTGTPTAHKSTKAQRYDPFARKFVSVEAIRNADGTLTAEDGGPIMNPRTQAVLARYFEPDEEQGRMVPRMDDGGWLGRARPVYQMPNLPAEDRAVLEQVLSDPMTAMTYGIDPSEAPPPPKAAPAKEATGAGGTPSPEAPAATPAAAPSYPVGTVVEQDGVRYQFDGQDWVEVQ